MEIATFCHGLRELRGVHQAPPELLGVEEAGDPALGRSASIGDATGQLRLGPSGGMDCEDDGIAGAVAELERRRDLLLEELSDFVVIPPHGGWSFLVDVSPLGLTGPEASTRLLEKGRIAATAMVNWGGPHCENYVRLVFSNEGTARLRGIGERFRVALT